MEKIKKLKPELLGGFRDYLPEIMLPKQGVLDNIRRTFESFGFVPLETPALERSSVLGTDTDEFKMEVYRFNASGQDVTLRFDLTVPLARVVAAYPQLLKPFKRYQVGPVWRKEKPQAGRFREFMQFDADIVGSDSILADSEIIELMYQTMINLKIDNFVIRFNNRKILNGLSQVIGFDDKKSMDVFRVMDKLEKIGLDEVVRELQRQPDNEYDESALAISDEGIVKLKEFLSLSGSLEELRSFFWGVDIALEGVSECGQIIENLRALAIPEKYWKFDLSVSRGLGYYTGPVFETTLLDIPEIGSVFSGGRYDELVIRYTGERVPATGASVGVDRLIAALDALGKIEKKKTNSRVLIAFASEKLGTKALALARQIRQSGINTETFMGRDAALKNQIIYAAKQGISFVIILGEEEEAKGMVKLKDMDSREESLCWAVQAIDRIRHKIIAGLDAP